MGWRPVIVAYAVLAALLAEYALLERRAVRHDEETPVRPRFIRLDPDAVRAVRLTRDGRTVVSRRGAGGWTVVEPPGAAIPPDLIGAFANALTGAEEIARLEKEDTPGLGLDAGATRVELDAETGAPVVVTIGATNPTGTAVYARRQGAAGVVLIGRNVRYYEDLIFQALSAERAPAAETGAPVGG